MSDLCQKYSTMILIIIAKWKLNRDGHQFHQYQQNEQSPLSLTEITEQKTIPRHMTLKIHVLAWDRNNNVAELNRLMVSQTPS
jgi:hypothetical protein